MIKACLFDLDGTLLDTLTTIAYYANLALNKYDLPSIETERYKHLIGNGAKLLVERMLKEVDAYSEDMFEKVYNYYNDSYNANLELYTKPYPGILDMLWEMKRRSISVGIISNKPDYATCRLSEKFFENGLICSCRGQIEGVAVKPSIEGAMAVLNELGADINETLYIGDTRTDMQTGKNLGAFTIGVLWGFRDYNELMISGADLIVTKPADIINYVDKCNL